MKYKINFKGRLNSAIGIFCKYSEIVQAENEESAILKLYDKYEHIHEYKIKEIK